MNKERDWRTREDPFKEMSEKVRSKLELNPASGEDAVQGSPASSEIMLCPRASFRSNTCLKHGVALVDLGPEVAATRATFRTAGP